MSFAGMALSPQLGQVGFGSGEGERGGERLFRRALIKLRSLVKVMMKG